MRLRDEQLAAARAAFMKIVRRHSAYYVEFGTGRIHRCRVEHHPVPVSVLVGLKVDFMNNWLRAWESVNQPIVGSWAVTGVKIESESTSSSDSESEVRGADDVLVRDRSRSPRGRVGFVNFTLGCCVLAPKPTHCHAP